MVAFIMIISIFILWLVWCDVVWVEGISFKVMGKRKEEESSRTASEQRKIQQEAFRLLNTRHSSEEELTSPFEDVVVAYPLHANFTLRIEDKLVVKPLNISANHKLLVYGAGIATHPQFEESMGAFGASVHAFDCTIPATSRFQSHVHFHHWCLGRASNFSNNAYSRASDSKEFAFQTLSETRRILGHKKVRLNILKMDIEGFEWELLYQEIILATSEDDLPDQLLFELHTKGANPECVPPHLTQDKTKSKVNELFLALWSKGYRVIFKLINPEDSTCADFTLLRIGTATNGSVGGSVANLNGKKSLRSSSLRM